MLETKRALKVDVSNLAKNGKTSAELLADVRSGAEDVIPGFLKPVATRVGVYEAMLLETGLSPVR